MGTTERKTHYALYGKKYYEANKEAHSIRNKKNYELNREQKLAKHREHVLKSRYGLTMDDYYCLLQSQGNKCAICKKEATKTLDVDHCHETGKVRGLLCNNCNRGLGHFQDDKHLLRNAMEYLDDNNRV